MAVLGLALLLAAGWTGLWFYGKGRIVEEIEAQTRLARARGAEAAYGAIEIGGFPFGYEGRIVSPEMTITQEIALPPSPEGNAATGLARYAWSAPWIEARASVSAPDTVEFAFPPRQSMVIDLPGPGEEPMPVALTSEDLRLATEHDGEEIAFRGGARSLGIAFSPPTGETGAVDVTHTLQGFAFSGETRRANAEGEVPRLFVTYAIEGTRGAAVVPGTSEVPGGRMEFGSGRIEGKADSLGSEAVGSATLSDIAATLFFERLGNQPLDIGIERVEVATRVPADAAPEPQPFAYRLAVEKVTLADLIWTMLDPAAAFAREINALRIDVEGTAVFSVPPSNAEAVAQAMETGLPIDVRTLSLRDLTLDALGARAIAEGEGRIEDDVPEGTATLGVRGFEGLLDALVENGRIPSQQALVVQLMVESFGKMDEDGETIRFDLEARDGMMYVNALPLGEAPALPE